MALVKFARGKKDSYSSTSYADYVYFASDTHEIILNDVVYGYDTSSYLEVSGISVSGDTLTITYTDSTGESTTVEYKAPSVSGSNAVGVTYDSENNDYKVALTIDSSDKILTQSSSGLLANLSLTYDSEKKAIYLYGADSTTAIGTVDCSDFIKDGMISSVELVHENDKRESGEFIKITWNTDEGGDVTYLDVTELVDVYTEGKGISIKDSESTTGAHEISVKIAGSKVDTGEGWDTNYLTLDEDGNLCAIGIDDAIKEAVDKAVEEVEAEAISTVVEKDSGASHLIITSSKSGNETTYTIGERDIASATDLSSLTTFVGSFDDIETGSVCDTINNLQTEVNNLESTVAANAVYVIAGTDEAHIKVTATSTGDSGTTYTVTSDDVASAALLGSQNDEAGAGTAFGAINQNAANIATNTTNIATNTTNITTLTEALTWVEVE